MNIKINLNTYLELEKIAYKVFFPLKGFMTQEDFLSVVKVMRLQNKQIFPLPVLLPITYKEKKYLKVNSKAFLEYKNARVAEIFIKSIFTINFEKYIFELFGTRDTQHPGYKILARNGKNFVGGPIQLLKKISYRYSKYSLTPENVKKKIKKLGLKTIAGFQTRNVPHKAHEYILKDALKKVDGIFIHPLIGKKKSGDFLPKAVLSSYELLIESSFPKNKVLLGALTTSMRYAGPREAVFHAIIRRNFGCTHFLVGRDHAGVGNYYREYEAQNLCIKLEKELKIKIIKVRGPFYCKNCDKITTDKICKNLKFKIEVSGTKIRDALLKNKVISNKFMRPEIVELIKKSSIFIR